MRYLKVIAQDQSGKGQPDTLHFHFYEDEQLQREATQADLHGAEALGHNLFEMCLVQRGRR